MKAYSLPRKTNLDLQELKKAMLQQISFKKLKRKCGESIGVSRLLLSALEQNSN